MRQADYERPIDISREPVNHEIIFLKPPECQAKAACLGSHPSLFFPEKGESTLEAKAICSGCEVKKECLQFALETREKFGIWGGKSEQERRKLRRVRRLQ